MININEYLLDKVKSKKYNVKRPEKGCELQDVMNWLDSFDVYNWYSDHSTLETPDKGCVGYHIGTGSWGNKLVTVDFALSKLSRQSIGVYPKLNSGYVSWGFGVKDQKISFEDAIKYMEQIMENPEKPKILKREEL